MRDDEQHLKYLQAETYTCSICDEIIVIEYVDDIHQDDSGDYHYDCHEDWAYTEANKWAGAYRADPFKLTAQEQVEAYEPGTAKRYAMEQELIGN
jgi:hypothetical protein